MTNNIYLAAANQLIATNGSTTTLDTKQYLRNQNPGLQVYQQEVSDAVDSLVENRDLIVESDNGTYRTLTNIRDLKVTREKLAEIIIDNLNTTMYLEYKGKNPGGGLKTATVAPDYYSILGYVSASGHKIYLSRVKKAIINNITYTT